MAETARIFEQDDRRAARLRELGVPAHILLQAIEAGESERRTCTKFDPLILGGVIAWGRTMRSLREQFVPMGWASRDVKGLPLVVRPDGAFAITVATGDEHTGLDSTPPLTKYRKGPAFPVTGDRQLSLLEADDDLATPQLPDQVWVLLLSRTPTEIRYELSQPTFRRRDGKIGFNADRIIFPPISMAEVVKINEDDDQDDDVGLDVEVERI